MDHIYLLGLLINLILGAAVIVYFYQIFLSFPFPFLKPMVWHLILFNSALIVLYLYKYLEINVPDFSESEHYNLYLDLGYLLVCFLLNGIVLVMARIMTAFLEIRPKYNFVYLFIAGFILITLSFTLKMILSDNPSLNPWTNGFYYYLPFLFFFAEILLLIILMINGNRKNQQWKQLIYSFVLINLSHYLLLTIVTISPNSIIIIISYLYFNLSPLFWLIVLFLKFARSLANQAESSGVMDILSAKYKISEREKDIIRLILLGKSNTEIKDTLFISYHTVKNHIYSLYGKLNVISRYELIILFVDLQKNLDKLGINGK